MRFKKITILLILTLMLVLPFISQAQASGTANNINDVLKGFGDSSGLVNSSKSPLEIITSIISIALGFLGVIFFILILMSGFKWMTTTSPEEIKKVRAKIINAVIGLVIVLAAYGLTTFISSAIFSSLQ